MKVCPCPLMVVSCFPKERTRSSDEESTIYFFCNISTRLFDVLETNEVDRPN